MKKKGIIFSILLFLVSSCTQKQTEIVLFEMKNFDNELQLCVHNALHNKSEISEGRKIFFKDITGIEPNKVKSGTRKLIISLHNNQTDSTVYNVQQFLFESNGEWRRILNMGNFTVTKELSNESICDRIVETGIIAQFK